MNLERDGWALVRPALPAEFLDDARRRLFAPDKAGSRFLLDDPTVTRLALLLRDFLAEENLAPRNAAVIQAIAFDKTPGANWKVPWHQDLMFPSVAEDWELTTEKEGIPYARPPAAILERLLAARLHLDVCGEENGPLRVAPGSHLLGVIPSNEAATHARCYGEAACLADEGEVILMRPLTLHASSQATSPHHRRVLHFVYDEGGGGQDRWFRAVS